LEFFGLAEKMAEEIDFENRHFLNFKSHVTWPWPRMNLKVISSWMSYRHHTKFY